MSETGRPEIDERMRKIANGAMVAAIDPVGEAEVRTDVPYSRDGETGPRLDLHLPRGTTPAPRGAWLFVHGGPMPPALEAIRATRTFRIFRDYGALAAAAGRVGVLVGHRYSSIEAIPGSERDVRDAVGWVRAHAVELGVDADRLSLWLFSGAGVHLRSFLVSPPPGVASVVAFYPVASAAALAGMGAGPLPAGYDPPSGALPASERAPRLFVARAGLEHAAVRAALDSFVAELLAANVELELANHARGQHGFDLMDDVERSRELVESAVRFLVRGESADEALPRVVRPAQLD